MLGLLRRWGFAVSPESRLCRDLEAALSYHDELLQSRPTLPIETDGSFSVYRVDAKTMPDSRAPEIAERAHARVWLDRIGQAVDEHIRWELVP